MKDQADKLRKIVVGRNNREVVPEDIAENRNGKEVSDSGKSVKNARVISITSGKGGVGKTNIAVNLALALMEAGKRVVILDADFGLANIEVVLGVVPKFNLLDVLQNKRNLLGVISHGPHNIRFISGGSGVEELAKLPNPELKDFIRNIHLLDRLFDVIIVDTGAGISENVISMALAGDEVMLVTTPEPTSITDAYAIMKIIASKDEQKKIRLLVNRAENENEARLVFQKLKQVTGKFIGCNIESLGYLNSDEAVRKAVKRQKPFLISYPNSQAAMQIRALSSELLLLEEESRKDASNGARGFINRFVRFFMMYESRADKQ